VPSPGGNDALFADVVAALRPDAAEAEPPPLDLAPDVIPGHRLLEVVQRRGARAVYRALEADSGATVAVKVLLGEPWSSARERERFRREAELSQALLHEDIVPVLDAGTTHGHLWLLRPWVTGEPLDRFAARVRPRRDARLRLFSRICRAVGHAHRCGVLHRDLQPGNVLIDAGGAPHLVDFGLGKALAPSPRVTVTQEFVGTPAYAAPEQVEGRAVTTATDVYALGVLGCELLTGSLPYEVGGGFSRLAARICADEPRVDERDVTLRAVLLKALEKDPARRYGTAEALADDLGRCLEGRPVALPGLPRVYLLRRALRRHRRAFAVGFLGAAVAAGGAWFALRLHLRATTQTAAAHEVQDLLREVIAAAQPDRMGGGVPLLDVLDQVARRLDTTLRAAPDVQAEVQLTLGDTYRRLHLPERAEVHLGNALARAREVGAPAPALARVLLALGIVQSERCHPAATATLREGLAQARQAFGDDSVEVARARSALGTALANDPFASDLAAARQQLDAAHAAWVRAEGEDSPEVAASRSRLAGWHWLRGERDVAVRQYQLAAECFSRHEAADDGAAVECYNDFAGVLQALGRLDEAEQWLQRAAALTTRLFGERRTADMLRRFARLHFGRGDFALSETFALRAVAAALAGITPPGAAGEPLRALAAELPLGMATGRGRVALLGAFRALRAHHGPGEYEVASWLHGMAHLAAAREQQSLRADLLREALQYRCRLFGGDCPVRGRCLDELAECCAAAGDGDEAARLRAEAARIAALAGERR